MAKRRRKPTIEPNLAQFYSDQAAVLIYQFQTINHLLGQTSDWTHPGSHCEILLRNFIRSQLPKRLSVDKGYVYGRVLDSGRSRHCPEIDILIHDETSRPPLFRLDDFVIVEPQTVVGIIQVKRSFKAVAKSDPLASGLKQVFKVNSHILNLRAREPGNPRYSDTDILPFSAVWSFDSSESVNLKNTLRNHFARCAEKCRLVKKENGQRIILQMMPSFVGALQDVCVVSRPDCSIPTYLLYPSAHNGMNVSLSLLLFNMLNSSSFSRYNLATKPLEYPYGMTPTEQFYPLPEGVELEKRIY